ncbi:MAG: hypothetical protein KGI38_04290 [Thaumarchaeota archaeon]|nr:hypothetical protein [Nitrososphaerota archaeon]
MSAVVCVAIALLVTPFYYFPASRSAVVSATAGGSTLTWSDSYVMIQHRIPENNSNPWAVTTDSEGKVWFVEQGKNQLGMYDPASGTFTQYRIPTPRSSPAAVAVDSEGDVWFSELTSNRLGELPKGGSEIVEYPVPPLEVVLVGTAQSVDCGPGAVLPDPSGSVWVACLFSNQVDEFFPGNGTFARFPLPVFESAPAGLLLDGHGGLWFTAADAQMLGEAVLSQLRNGTSDGIMEFAPLNGTYPFKFNHPTSFLNTSTLVTSSLPTPSGIAMDPSGRLWITEHVDSSFDSYDPATSSLVKYWTSQTYGAYGFPASFPNGISVDANGTVWIGEHYGNRIAEFQPSAGVLMEFPVPCCSSTLAGVYSVALDRNGTLWFVEIQGDALGEVVRTDQERQFSLSLPETAFGIVDQGSLTLPLTYSEPSGQGNYTSLTLKLSGVSGTGALENMTGNFTPATLSLAPGGTETSNLTLSLSGLDPGVYYLTLTADSSPRGVLYSAILKLTVLAGWSLPVGANIVAAAALTVTAAAIAWGLGRRLHGHPPPEVRPEAGALPLHG